MRFATDIVHHLPSPNPYRRPAGMSVEQFGDLQQEAVYYSNRRILRQLYRSRFRLLRGSHPDAGVRAVRQLLRDGGR